jgi:hypothetical protein
MTVEKPSCVILDPIASPPLWQPLVIVSLNIRRISTDDVFVLGGMLLAVPVRIPAARFPSDTIVCLGL